MLRRILAILPLLFVIAAAEEDSDLPCRCEIYWARKEYPGPYTVTFRLAQFDVVEIEAEKEDKEDCGKFSSKCLKKCEDRLQTEYEALNLKFDHRFKLGKMLCEKAGVGISVLSPRHIFMRANIEGCEAFDNVLLGQLCCVSCVNSGVVEISYNPGCSPEYRNYNMGKCDI